MKQVTKRRKEKVQSELVADGNEDDESIALEPSGKPKKKKGKKVKKKKSSPKDGKQADICRRRADFTF